MNRTASIMTVIISAILVTGCTVTTAPPVPTVVQTSPAAMPEVVVIGPSAELRPLTGDELLEMKVRPVSSAVDTLTRRGYVTVQVTDRGGNLMAQRQWDAHSVLTVTLEGNSAHVVAG